MYTYILTYIHTYIHTYSCTIGGIPVDKFVHMTKRLCGLPSFFNLPLCKRIQQYSDEGSSYKANRGSGGAQVFMNMLMHTHTYPYMLIYTLMYLCIHILSVYLYTDFYVPFHVYIGESWRRF